MFYLVFIFLAFLLRPATAKWFLSKLIDTFLQLRYPIRHQNNRSRIPGLPFEWANGQGTEKFFHGHQAAQRWRVSMGSIYQIWSGFRPEVVLTHPSYTRPYFRNSNHHVKAADNNSGWLFGEVLGSCVGLVSGARWHALRSELEPFFTHSAATAHITTIIEAARGFVSNDLPAPILDHETDTFIISMNPSRDLQFFPFFSVAGMLFGDPLSHQQRAALRNLAPLREELFREVIRGGINRWGKLARLFRSSGTKLLTEFHAQWLRFVEEAYESAKKGQRSKDKVSLQDENEIRTDTTKSEKELPIFRLWEAVQEGRISERECLQTLDESLYANLDVTTNAVAWNIVLLAQHPEVQSQLRDEILKVQHSDLQSYAQYIDRSDTFLAACVVESSRLRPILPFSNPEFSPDDDINIAGYTIPRNTNIVVDSHAINVSNPFWVDGTKYNPARHFILKKEQVRYNLWRFGFGPRQCLGKHFADRMLRCITAEMVGRYAMSVPGKNGLDREVKIQEDSWVSLPDAVVHCVPIKTHVHISARLDS